MSTWPQLTMAALYAISMIHTLYQDGKKGNGMIGAIITIAVNATFVGILYAGGFWSVWGFTP